jgi:hypothetical protein
MQPHAPQSGGEIVPGSKIAPVGKIEPRRLIWAVAEVWWADAAGRPIQSRAIIVDISTSGACIRLKDRIGIGSQLTIKWHREQFAATARNCRADGSDYLLGVRRDGSPPPQANAPRTAPPVIAASTPSSAHPALAANTSNRPAVAAKPAAVRESALQENNQPIAERRAEAAQKGRALTRHFEFRSAVALSQEAGRRERKAMQPKRLFPNFWRRQPAVDAPVQLASKESSVNKPVPAELVSDPPAHLLSYEDIYHAAGIMTPRSGYDIRKVVDMLNSERIRDLSKDIQRASVLMALDAAGASVGELLQDATRRQQALNAYEDGQRKQLQEFEAHKAQEIAQIEAEMQRITAHYTERIQQNKDEVAKHKEALHNWQMAKQHESHRITEVMELCGKPATPAPEATMAATAGASGIGTAGGTTQRTSTAGDSQK